MARLMVPFGMSLVGEGTSIACLRASLAKQDDVFLSFRRFVRSLATAETVASTMDVNWSPPAEMGAMMLMCSALGRTRRDRSTRACRVELARCSS